MAVVIEGPSPLEQGGQAPVADGADVIDVSEYYGSERFEDATRIDYVQLKHSTLQSRLDWTASGLTPTLAVFAARYLKLIKAHGRPAVLSKLRFRFVSNRLVALPVRETIADLAAGTSPRHQSVAALVKKACGLSARDTEDFFARVEVDGSQPSFSRVEDFLALDTKRLIVGDDLDAALRLRSLVSDKATSLFANDPGIRRGEVLLALRVGEDELLPAKPEFECLTDTVAREQEAELQARVMAADGPVIITADGGVGKSVVATRLHHALPPGSASVLYDCFGGGEYRRLDRQRHPLSVGLTQIANELALDGLCDPMLPKGADDPALLKAFLHRLGQASRAVRSAAPEALLLIVVDAADNAMTAAEGSSDPAFVPHLLAADLPEGVRLVMLCRPDRLDSLQAPAGIEPIPLRAFSRAETARMLRGRYAAATEAQVTEFHRLTSQNPRVQANALATTDTLVAALRSLGSKPRSVDDIIADQLRAALTEVRKHASDAAGIDALCAGLATLHPLVPIPVLARLAAVDPSAVRSFASDFGRGRWLMIAGDAVQFRDEPVEAWFRNAYAATPTDLGAFADRLAPLAAGSAYVAASLPALLLEAGRLDHLVAMALTTDRLPLDSPLERREVEAMRVQHALKASLRQGRLVDAAKLAIKAAEVAAGSTLQDQLLRDQADLFGVHLDAGRLQAIVARGLLGGWLGARYTREAALCSQNPELRGEALSKLRSADDLLIAWSRGPEAERQAQPFTPRDRADLAFAHLNLSGPADAVREIIRWRPAEVGYKTAKDLVVRLIDHGRFAEADAVAVAAHQAGSLAIAAGAVVALGRVNRAPPRTVVEALLARKPSRPSDSDQGDGPPWDRSLVAVTAIVEAAGRLRGFDPRGLARRLKAVLPKVAPDSLGERWGRGREPYLRAAALLAVLRDTELEVDGLLSPPGGARPDAASGDTGERAARRRRLGGLLPWTTLRARVLLGLGVEEATMAWDAAREKSQGAFGYHAEEATDVQDAILDLMHDVLIDSDLDAAPRLLEIERWVEARSRPMFTPTWAGLARKTARTPRFADQAVLYAQRSCSNEWADAAERADSKIGTHVAAARALLSHDPQEAFAHLERAVEVAGLLGDEAPLRWEALRSLARASDDGSRWPELAYRFARAGEFASAYMEEYFNWGHAVTAIAGLDALTSVAVVGRWRDRGVGPPFKSLLESLERTLRERSVLNPSVSVSFLGFSEDWPLGEMMEAALATSSPAARPAVVAAFARHLDLRSGPRRIWRDLLAVARRHGADGRAFQTGLNRLPRDDRPGRSARYRPSSAWKTGFSKRLSLEPIRTPADAFTRLETQAAVTRVFDRQIAWTLMLASISPERVADFLSELLVSADLPAHSILTVIEALPDAVRRRLAVRQALQQAGLTLARRRWRQFRHGESGGLTPARFAEATGLETGEVIAAMLDGVAAEPGLASPQDLFELVPHIASRLDPRQAADALSHGVGLIEAVMPPAFGDGGWSLAVEPPTDMAEAIGNLLWGALSSPLEATRWEAAHAVRLLFDLDCGEVLNSLAARLEASTPGPCASPSRPFYRLNAELWCLLAVARACRDHPERAASFLRCIERAAAAANDHVLIRRTAASALLSLADAGWLDMTPDARSRLVAIDAPDRAPRIVDTFITGGDWYSQKHRKNGHFRFDYERAKGDALALANAFGLGADRVEKLAEDVVLQVWREPYNSKAPDPRDNDPAWSRRGRGRAFQGYREYLGLHAMLTVAGQLARTRQPLRHRSATRDDFTDWLRRFDLTRRDGTWLSDRLNPAPPLTRPDCPDPALWRWSVTRRDLEGWWNPTPTECVVAAEWIQAEGGREQTVRINSALVAPGTAAAMMAACQTASNAWDYYIPSADQDEINQEPFHVRGWIEDHRVERGLDAGDPWTSAMATSPLRPAAWIARRFRLRADPLEQTWRSRRTAPPTFRADLWATHGDLVRDHQGPNGQRLMVRKTELLRMMRRLRRDLLIEVQMSRLLDGRYGESDDAGPFSPRSSFLLLLFRQDGSVETAC